MINLTTEEQKDILKAIISLDGNSDFEKIKAFLSKYQDHCSYASCFSPDGRQSSKLAGAYLELFDINNFISSAEVEFGKLEVKGKTKPLKQFP